MNKIINTWLTTTRRVAVHLGRTTSLIRIQGVGKVCAGMFLGPNHKYIERQFAFESFVWINKQYKAGCFPWF